MEKFIKGTSIGSIIAFALSFILGKWIAPAVYFFLFSPHISDYNMGFVFYYGMTLFDFVQFLIMLLFIVLILASLKGEKTGIMTEIIGYVVVLVVLPIEQLLVKQLVVIVAGRIAFNNDAFAAYSMLTTGSSFLGFLSMISTGLLLISLTASVCRKKWCTAEEYNED